MSEKTVKLEGWKPRPQPEEGPETQTYRKLIIEAVETIYADNLRRRLPFAVSLAEIYIAVRNKVTALSYAGKWHYSFHSKRWIDRRVNEAACSSYYEDGVPKIVAVSAGLYVPNPELLK